MPKGCSSKLTMNSVAAGWLMATWRPMLNGKFWPLITPVMLRSHHLAYAGDGRLRGASRPQSSDARVARDVLGLAEQHLGDALTAVRLLVDPILSRSATGTWDPADVSWGVSPMRGVVATW